MEKGAILSLRIPFALRGAFQKIVILPILCPHPFLVGPENMELRENMPLRGGGRGKLANEELSVQYPFEIHARRLKKLYSRDVEIAA